MLRARLTRGDGVALAVLVALPVVVNLPWALAGHPVLNGDNLTQNYPLRVLAGELMAHGRLPLWDPGIWSGVPLLAGWNAGAMFPGTWLFAIMAPVAAYELNVILTGIACGVGFHLFLRRSGCSPLASVLGALTFSEMGFVSGQDVHLGLVQGTALAPFILLSIDGLFRAARSRNSPGPWVALLGVSGGLVVLAGDPRAISNDAIIAVVYLAARCWRERGLSIRLAAGLATGTALSVAVGAVQWLPGLAYLHTSQRSVSSLALFGYYSLGWNSLPLLVVPSLVGGNGNFGMPDYAGPLNGPEVTFAVGILPLVALFALLPALLRRWRPGGNVREGLGVWYAMFLVGAVLTTGSKTPLGHLLVHVPLYGGQRDQNRNAAIADFALAALLGLFVDGLRADGHDAFRALGARGRQLARFLGLVPVAAVLGLVVAMFAATGPMERWLGVHPLQPRLPGEMAGYYAAAIVIALGGAVVLLWPRWRSDGARRAAAAGVVAADVLLFVAMASYQAVPTSVLAASNPSLRTLVAQLPAGSRIAIDDPDQLALDQPAFLADKLGVNDLVLLHSVTSVQGYGSAVPTAYGAATGTHDVENLLPSALLGPTFDELDLGLLAVVPEQFGTILAPGSAVRLPPGPPQPLGTSAADRQPGGVARAAYPPAGPWRLGRNGVTWQLPAPTGLSGLTVIFEPTRGPIPPELEISAHLADGRTVTSPIVSTKGRTSVEIPLSAGAVAAGGGALSVTALEAGTAGAGPRVAVPGGTPVVGAAVAAVPAGSAPLAIDQPATGTPVRFALDGLLQGFLTPPRWRYSGHIGPFVLYRNTEASGTAWLVANGGPGPPGRSLSGGTASSLELEPWQDPVTIVDARTPSLLVRSEQYGPGWSATVQAISPSNTLGPPSTQAVRAVGLLQGVEVPAGRYRVTWHYHSGRAEIGLALSAVGVLVCAALAAGGRVVRRRREGGATT